MRVAVTGTCRAIGYQGTVVIRAGIFRYAD